MLAVKGNQDHLEEDIVAAFEAVDDGQGSATVRTHTAYDKGHGRQEMHRTQTMAVPETLAT